MATSKDIKELMEARKAARRAIPQVDPAQVVAGPPEPEVAVSAMEPRSVPMAAEEQPAPSQPSPDAVVVLEPGDPRTQPAPTDNPHMAMTLKVRRHHHRQLKAEAYYKGLLMQDIFETALDEYFKKRYPRHKRG